MSSFNKKYQIFISSTFTDLKEERDEVTKAILTHYHIPIGMEMFSADDAEQWETIQDTIDSSDYYVLIIGHRYGSIDPEDGVSYTEKEFNYARSKGIPTLVFVRDRDHATTPAQRDSDPEYAVKLNAFIESATNKRLVSFWKNKDDLAAQVMASFQKASRKNDRIGWVRADSVPNANEVLAELAFLQKENRELKSELEVIRIKRLPAFDILFENSKKIDILSDANRWPRESFIKLNNGFDRGHFYSMDEFNSVLRSNKTIADEYNQYKLKYLIENHYQRIPIKIINVGTSKASDINITINLPTQLNLLFESRNQIPRFAPDETVSSFAHVAHMVPNPNKDINLILEKIPFESYSRHDYEITKIMGGVSIKIPALLHTRDVTIDRFYIGGSMEPFEDAIKVSVVYEETPEPIRFEIPISNTYIHNQQLIEIE